jgi:hypothetical protein
MAMQAVNLSAVRAFGAFIHPDAAYLALDRCHRFAAGREYRIQ